MKELSLEQMSVVKGGECTADEAVGIAIGLAGLALLIAFPPSAFLIPIAGTLGGVSLGASIAGCID